jgi:hypothetical protein
MTCPAISDVSDQLTSHATFRHASTVLDAQVASSCATKLLLHLATPPREDASYPARTSKGGLNMLWTIFAILLILWLLGFSFHVAGSLIHLLLVAAVIVLIVNLITGRRTVV